MIVSIKTDQQDAYVAISQNGEIVAEKTWTAHRELSDTLLKTIEELLSESESSWNDLSGVVVFQGPGSFTGLRIGITVANTLAASQGVPVVATQGDNWRTDGESRIANDDNDEIVLPEYGGEANITKPRK